MWLAMPDSFVSIVAHRTRPRCLLVRGRSWVDMDAFAERVAAVDAKHQRPEIEVTDGADYPFRLVATRRNVGKVLADFVVSDLSYGNFKDEVGKDDPERASLYHEVWSTLRGIEGNSRSDVVQPDDPPPTRAAMRALLRFLPIFERAEFAAGALRTSDGATLPTASYAADVQRFWGTLYRTGFVMNFDWPKWGRTAARYTNDPRVLAGADLDTIRKLFTTMVRRERFCEGSLLGDFDRGLVVATLRRLRELAV